MKKILIADTSKASLVMTSEVFKDNFPGVQVIVAKSSAEAIELAKSAGPVDAFIIDFDLPDRDGAHTAARIKKLCNTPVLITAFDRPEVTESIERELAAYDDCLSWLKKPVKSEVVVAVATRFCEGKYRCQRRVACEMPSFIEFSCNVAPEKGSARKSAAPAGKATAQSKGLASPAKVSIPMLIDDVSLGGVKLKVHPRYLRSAEGRDAAERALSSMNFQEQIAVQTPNFESIEQGLDVNKSWFEGRVAGIEKVFAAQSAAKGAAKKKSPTMPLVQSAAGNRRVVTQTADSQLIRGKWAWSRKVDGEWVLGIQFENPGLAKKLFEAMLARLALEKAQALSASAASAPVLAKARGSRA